MKIEIPEHALRSVAFSAHGVVAHSSQKSEVLGKVILLFGVGPPIFCRNSPLMGIMTGGTGEIPRLYLLAVRSEYGSIPCSTLVEAHDIGYQFARWMEGHWWYFFRCHVPFGMATCAQPVHWIAVFSGWTVGSCPELEWVGRVMDQVTSLT